MTSTDSSTKTSRNRQQSKTNSNHWDLLQWVPILILAICMSQCLRCQNKNRFWKNIYLLLWSKVSCDYLKVWPPLEKRGCCLRTAHCLCVPSICEVGPVLRMCRDYILGSRSISNMSGGLFSQVWQSFRFWWLELLPVNPMRIVQ